MEIAIMQHLKDSVTRYEERLKFQAECRHEWLHEGFWVGDVWEFAHVRCSICGKKEEG